MSPGRALATGALVLALTACNRNSAPGNDREAQLDPAIRAAPIVQAGVALANVSSALLKPETMSDADIEALGGTRGRCAVRMTEVGFPSFLYRPDGSGAIKLNGRLIVLPAAGQRRFAGGGLSVTLMPLDEEGNAGLMGMRMIVVPPGAQDELGYDGYVRCYGGAVP